MSKEVKEFLSEGVQDVKDKVVGGVQDVKDIVVGGVQDVKDKVVGGFHTLNKATSILRRKIISDVGNAKELNKKVISYFTGKEKALEHPSTINFSSDEFDYDDYTDTLFSKSDYKQIESNWLAGLSIEQTKAKEQLQELVAENYIQFIDASKEVSSFMDVDLIEIGNLVTAMKNVISDIDSVDLTLDNRCLYPTFKSVDVEALREVEYTMLPELEMEISQRLFHKAAELVELIDKKLVLEDDIKMEKDYRASLQQLKKKFYQKRMELSDSLSESVKSGLSSNKDVKLLEKISGTEMAISTYLKGKKIRIKNILTKIECRGNVEEYTKTASKHVFKMIEVVCAEFRELFPEASNTSFFIQWSFEVLEKLVATVKVQILGQQCFETTSNSINVIIKRAQQLEKMGITVSFFIHKLLLPDVEKVMRQRCIELREEIFRTATSELWNYKTVPCDSFAVSLPESVKQLKVGQSCIVFVNNIRTFIINCSLIVSSYSFNIVNMCVTELFETTLSKFYEIGLSKTISEKQFFVILSSSRFILQGMLEEVSEMLKLLFDKNLPVEITILKSKIFGFDTRLLEKYCQNKAFNLVDEKIGWNHSYIAQEITSVTSVSRYFVQVLSYFEKLANHIASSFDKDTIPIMKLIVKYMVEYLTDKENVMTGLIEDTKESTKKHKVNQIILDLSYVKQQLVSKDFISEEDEDEITAYIDFIRDLNHGSENILSNRAIEEILNK